MKRILLAALVCLPALAQEGARVNVSQGPPWVDFTRLIFYVTATSNVEYVCVAESNQATTTFSRSDSTLTSIAVSANTATFATSTAHGLNIGNKVTVSGATVDADLNGDYKILTVPSTTTFTATTAGVSDATYNESTLKFATNAPLTTKPIWKIQKISYTGNDPIRDQSTTGTNNICDNRASATTMYR